MFYIVESSKSFYEATFDLEPVVQRLGFVVLHRHDLSETLHRKGIELDDDCQVFDICNYRDLEKMLVADLRLALTLPWRIAVYTEHGATKIGLLRPEALFAACGQNTELARLASDIEGRMRQIVDETR